MSNITVDHIPKTNNQVVNWLKRNEQEDYFDRETNFTPFKF